MFHLDGKTAIVTGAARGIGAGIAQCLSSAGATVIAADTSYGAGSVAGSGVHKSRQPYEVRLDVTDDAAVTSLIDQTVKEFGKLDVLVNNAGIWANTPILDVDNAEIRRLFEVNVYGVIHGIRAAGRVMKVQGAGRIINIASQQGKVAVAGSAGYSASKAAVLLLTQAAALELAPFGVTVNAICPGSIWTEAVEETMTRNLTATGISIADQMQAQIDAAIPAGRYGTAADVGQAVAWLVSDEAAFVSGADLNVSGAEQVFF